MFPAQRPLATPPGRRSTGMTATLTANPPRVQADQRLGGTVALVTGASRGLGLLLAGTLADAGASVGLVARSAEQLAQARDQIIEGGGAAVAVAADLCDREAVTAAVKQVSRSLGPIDVLVNNAWRHRACRGAVGG